MRFCANANRFVPIIYASLVLGSFTPAFVINLSLCHIQLLVSPTLPVKLDAEVWIIGLFGLLCTAITANRKLRRL